MENKFIDRIIVAFGLAILFLLVYITLRALIIPIFLAFIFGYFFRPVYNPIYKRIKIKFISALIVIIAIISFVVFPFILLAPSLVRQTFNFYLKLQNLNLGNLIRDILPANIPVEMANTINLQVNNILSRLFSYLMNAFSSFLMNLPSNLLALLIFIVTLYFVLRDYEQIRKFGSDLLPLSNESKLKFATVFKNVTDGVLYGQILVGILQGILFGMILFILAIEGALIFTVIAIIAGVLPMIGLAIIWIPISILLIIEGALPKAVLLIICGNLISWITDGGIKPYIISKKTELPLALSFLGGIGGLYAFGIPGLILGPLLMAYLLIILQFYKEGRFNELFR